jgi:hypothetical protein
MQLWKNMNYCGFLLLVVLGYCVAATPYLLDDSGGLGRVFDGIGGLSGGGVSSFRLCVQFLDASILIGYFSSSGELPIQAKR